MLYLQSEDAAKSENVILGVERRPIGEEDSFGNETGEQRLPGEDERHADRLQFQFHRGQAEERTAENGRAQWKEE